MEGWFIWMSGDGPLLATNEGELEFVFDRDGQCAYRVNSTERVTLVATESLKDHWIYVAVAKAGSDAILRVNEGIADRWGEAPSAASLSDFLVMRDAVGFAADIAYYSRRLPDDRLDAHWNAGQMRV